jgi:hypothetical protein
MADESQKIRAELELENSEFLAALKDVDLAETQFAEALKKVDLESDQLLGDEQKRTTIEEEQSQKRRQQIEAELQAEERLEQERQRLVQEELQAKERLEQEGQRLLQSLNSVALAAQNESIVMGRSTTAVAALNAGHADLGRTFLQTSYAVQDFTSVMGTQGLGRAFASIQNNIPLLLMGLGAGAGLTGVLSVLSVGVGQLVDHWGDLVHWWQGGQTAEEAARMKELAKQTEEAAKSAEKLLKTRPPEERKQVSAVEAAIQRFGGPEVEKSIGDAMRAAFGQMPAEMVHARVVDLLAQMRSGSPQAIDFFHQLMMGWNTGRVPGGPVAQALRGETPKPFKGKSLNQLRVEAEAKETERLAKFADSMDKNMRASREYTADQRVKQSMQLARAFDKARAEQRRQLAGRERGADQEDRQAQTQIQHLHDANTRILQLQANGQATQLQAGAAIARNNAQIARLMARQRQIWADMRRLREEAERLTQQNVGNGN